MRRAIPMGLALLLGACQMQGADTSDLGPNRTAFAAEGMTVWVTRNATTADVTIVSGMTLTPAQAEIIARQAAAEATRCTGIQPTSTKVTSVEGTVRVALSNCPGGV
ncbi:hypothetical protein BV394_07750 [Brevirhabdus pacifica]|uniref:DUF4156 domain-containing protein n=1 Tax=Brevirhabdus pacifica TaxID=1267768 RepID=A0A1U7DI35_9RHOB|nr:hypothetical protein [Brevirhabdus pacifica]APX89621.1 hypothetical protein BV394_07750 [Brevirhabdus pacifica]OWU74267.1 hypothetical protein ATO5_14545 [Loktanella sp. 22II-4b]